MLWPPDSIYDTWFEWHIQGLDCASKISLSSPPTYKIGGRSSTDPMQEELQQKRNKSFLKFIFPVFAGALVRRGGLGSLACDFWLVLFEQLKKGKIGSKNWKELFCLNPRSAGTSSTWSTASSESLVVCNTSRWSKGTSGLRLFFWKRMDAVVHMFWPMTRLFFRDVFIDNFVLHYPY